MRDRATLLCEHTYAYQSPRRRDVHNIEQCELERVTYVHIPLHISHHNITQCAIEPLGCVNIPMHISHYDVEMYII